VLGLGQSELALNSFELLFKLADLFKEFLRACVVWLFVHLDSNRLFAFVIARSRNSGYSLPSLGLLGYIDRLKLLDFLTSGFRRLITGH